MLHLRWTVSVPQQSNLASVWGALFLLIVAGWAHGAGSVIGLLNGPRVWWAQGDLGLAGSPGGWVRLFGMNLALEGSNKPASTTIRVQGAKTVLLAAQADVNSAKAAGLPTTGSTTAVGDGTAFPAATA